VNGRIRSLATHSSIYQAIFRFGLWSTSAFVSLAFRRAEGSRAAFCKARQRSPEGDAVHEIMVL
jgi:hypothetical protein